MFVNFRETIINAIKRLNTLDEDELFQDCLENETNEIVEKSTSEEQKQNDNSTSSTLLNFDLIRSDLMKNVRVDIYQEYDDDRIDGLEAKFDQIWSSFCIYLDCNFEHCVSMNHLGWVLRHIKEANSTVIKRERPAYLESNVANLIVCPKDEIIKRTLSIYSLTPDQELPGCDEILYCNSETSFEDIELFWRRVLSVSKSNNEEKIYSLVNVQVGFSFQILN